MKPFSKNIIFFDTEFTSLDPNIAELISIGLVKPDGEELYLELEYKGEPSEFVVKNVLPSLSGHKISHIEAVKKVKKFVGNTKPYIVGYINQDDVMYWNKLYMSVNQASPENNPFNSGNPFNLVSIDFATILFMSGINPEDYYFGDKNDFFEKN